MSNMEAFNIAVAEIFGKCYGAFPLPVTIDRRVVGAAVRQAFDNDPEGVLLIAQQKTPWLEKLCIGLLRRVICGVKTRIFQPLSKGLPCPQSARSFKRHARGAKSHNCIGRDVC